MAPSWVGLVGFVVDGPTSRATDVPSKEGRCGLRGRFCFARAWVGCRWWTTVVFDVCVLPLCFHALRTPSAGLGPLGVISLILF